MGQIFENAEGSVHCRVTESRPYARPSASIEVGPLSVEWIGSSKPASQESMHFQLADPTIGNAPEYLLYATAANLRFQCTQRRDRAERLIGMLQP